MNKALKTRINLFRHLMLMRQYFDLIWSKLSRKRPSQLDMTKCSNNAQCFCVTKMLEKMLAQHNVQKPILSQAVAQNRPKNQSR